MCIHMFAGACVWSVCDMASLPSIPLRVGVGSKLFYRPEHAIQMSITKVLQASIICLIHNRASLYVKI